MRELEIFEEKYQKKFEELEKQFSEKIKVANFKDKKVLEEKFKKQIGKFLLKKEKDYEKFLKKYKNSLFDKDSIKEETIKKYSGSLNIKSFNFKKAPKENFQYNKKLFLFHFRFNLRKFWLRLTPSKIRSFFFRLSLFFRTFLFNLRNILSYKFNRLKLKIFSFSNKVFKSFIKFLKKIFNIFSFFNKKILSFFGKKLKKKEKAGQSENNGKKNLEK